MKAIALLFIIAGSLNLSGCSNKKNSSMESQAYPFTFRGLLQKPEITSYMYGTHSISSNGIIYALESTAVNLDSYLNKTITIKGVKVEGYPLDGGPELINVKQVDKK